MQCWPRDWSKREKGGSVSAPFSFCTYNIPLTLLIVSLLNFVQNVKIVHEILKMKSQFYSTSEARKILSDLVNQVKYQGKSFSIGRRGNAEAVLSPVVIEQGEAKQALDFHEHIRNVRADKNMKDDLLSASFKKEFKKLAKEKRSYYFKYDGLCCDNATYIKM
jgi:hypothetical protein